MISIYLGVQEMCIFNWNLITFSIDWEFDLTSRFKAVMNEQCLTFRYGLRFITFINILYALSNQPEFSGGFSGPKIRKIVLKNHEDQ